MSDWREKLGADVLTLGMAADEVRREQFATNTVTYLRVHVVTAGDLVGALAVPEAASEVRIYVTPETVDEAVRQLRALKSAAGSRRVAAYSMVDLMQRGWAQRAEALRTLVEAGLDDVAELPVDQLVDLSGSIEALRTAGVDPQRLTISQPIGGQQIEIIGRARRAFDEHACVRRFSPLPRIAAIDKPTTGYDDVRMVALSRLALRNRSIEVDWSLYGPKLAQVALTFGADHLDAVPAVDDDSLGRRRTTVEDVERNIRAAGFTPQEFRPVP